MMNFLADLWKLQKNDLKIEQLKEDFRALEAKNKLKPFKKRLISDKEVLEAIKTKLSGMKREFKKTELDYNDLSLKATELEKKLYSGEIKNLKEMEQLTIQLENINQNKEIKEDLSLELIEGIEKLEKEIKRREQNLILAIQEYKQEMLKYRKEADKIEEEIFDQELQREQLLEKIDKKYIVLYEELKRNKQGIAIATIKGQNCSGCRVSLPSMIVSMTKAGNTIVKCENCGRILFWHKELEQEDS